MPLGSPGKAQTGQPLRAGKPAAPLPHGKPSGQRLVFVNRFPCFSLVLCLTACDPKSGSDQNGATSPTLDAETSAEDGTEPEGTAPDSDTSSSDAPSDDDTGLPDEPVDADTGFSDEPSSGDTGDAGGTSVSDTGSSDAPSHGDTGSTEDPDDADIDGDTGSSDGPSDVDTGSADTPVDSPSVSDTGPSDSPLDAESADESDDEPSDDLGDAATEGPLDTDTGVSDEPSDEETDTDTVDAPSDGLEDLDADSSGEFEDIDTGFADADTGSTDDTGDAPVDEPSDETLDTDVDSPDEATDEPIDVDTGESDEPADDDSGGDEGAMEDPIEFDDEVSGPMWPEGTDPFADEVIRFDPGPDAGYGMGGFPDVVLGSPERRGAGAGSLHVLSLGEEGQIVLAFTDLSVFDGPGPDLIVFENPFGTWFETAFVEASIDGEEWFMWPCDPEDIDGDYPGCAGVGHVFATSEYLVDPTDPEVAGGDAFDLADLGLGAARYVRITDTGFNALGYGGITGGFDLDAVAIANWERIVE